MKKFLAVATALSALAAGDALAATATSDIAITAKVNKTCTISTAALDFATYDPFAAGANTVTQASGVTLTCSKGTPYSVALSTGGGLSFAPRKMKGTGTNIDTISYNIFTDGSLGTVWGDGTASTGQVSGVAASKASFNLSVTGSITPGQDVTQDDYSDTITATVTF